VIGAAFISYSQHAKEKPQSTRAAASVKGTTITRESLK